MSVDLIVRGRIVTLSGTVGFGWVEAIAINDGRVVAAGPASELTALAGAATRVIELDPNEVAVPGLTDAHIHLAGAAVARLRLDLDGAASLADGFGMIRAAHEAEADPDVWIEGYGWDPDRWGRWPTAADLEEVAPGRRAALWAHDQHSFWVSQTALQLAGLTGRTPDPPGGAIRRGPDGAPSGILHEAAARLVSSGGS